MGRGTRTTTHAATSTHRGGAPSGLSARTAALTGMPDPPRPAASAPTPRRAGGIRSWGMRLAAIGAVGLTVFGMGSSIAAQSRATQSVALTDQAAVEQVMAPGGQAFSAGSTLAGKSGELHRFNFELADGPVQKAIGAVVDTDSAAEPTEIWYALADADVEVTTLQASQRPDTELHRPHTTVNTPIGQGEMYQSGGSAARRGAHLQVVRPDGTVVIARVTRGGKDSREQQILRDVVAPALQAVR